MLLKASYHLGALLMSATLICVAFASFWALWGIFRRSRVSLPHPPGPKGWPILGNLFDVPKEEPWAGYKYLSKKYGKPRACAKGRESELNLHRRYALSQCPWSINAHFIICETEPGLIRASLDELLRPPSPSDDR
jgi:hypothetical protein